MKGHQERQHSWLDKSYWLELRSKRWGRRGEEGVRRRGLGEASPLLGTGGFHV